MNLLLSLFGMALTADIEVLSMFPNVGYIVELPTAIADTYYKGALLNFDASGNPVVAADTSNHTFAGINQKHVVVASGETKYLSILMSSVVRLAHTGAAKTDIGAMFYATADDTLADSASNVGPCGMCVGFETGYVIIDTGIRVLRDTTA